MAAATTTTLGTIVLSGDLKGSNDGNSVELSPTGVVAGTYEAASLIIDAKGRVVKAWEATDAEWNAAIAAMTDASAIAKGVVQIGTNIEVASGIITVPLATTTMKGVVQAGSGLGMNTCIIELDSGTWPLATTTTPGVVIVPASGNLDVDGSGNISVPLATTTTPGVVIVPSSGNLDVDGSGNISVPLATTTTLGVVSVGSGLQVDVLGELTTDLVDATTSVKGIVQIDDATMDVTSGVVSIEEATNSNKGIMSTADSSNLNISAGLMDVGTNIPQKDATNTYTKANVVSLSTLSYSASITPDFSVSNIFDLTLTGDPTLNAPTNSVNGGTYIIIIKQDATGSRTITWNSAYKFDATPTLSTGANDIDVVKCTCLSSTEFICQLTTNYS